MALIGLLILGGIAVGAVVLWNAVDDATDDEAGVLGIVPGGDCLAFQAAFINLTSMSMLGAGGPQTEQLESQLGDLQQLVPSEIEDDFDVVQDAFREAMRLGTGGGGLIGAGEVSDEQQAEAEAVLETPEVQEAQANINDWVRDNCG